MNWVLVGGGVVLVWVIVTFNRLTRLRQLSDNAWADIDVQLKRRHDLIPQVVAVVKGHAGYERQTLEAVVAARGRAVQAAAGSPATRFKEETPVEASLSRIFAIAEAYPDLKAVASFVALQQTLTEVEDTLQNARRYYNAVVRDWNTGVAQFPANLLTNVFRFQPREFFGIDDADRAVPTVDTGARA